MSEIEIVIGFTNGSTYAIDGKFILTCFSSEEEHQSWDSETDFIEYVSVNEKINRSENG